MAFTMQLRLTALAFNNLLWTHEAPLRRAAFLLKSRAQPNRLMQMPCGSGPNNTQQLQSWEGHPTDQSHPRVVVLKAWHQLQLEMWCTLTPAVHGT